MDIQLNNSRKLGGLSEINIVLGKNGCGKSSLLRELAAKFRNEDAAAYTRYITPERGGVLQIDGNVETNLSNPNWLQNTRERNRFEQFRQTSVSEFRKLETIVLRKIESDEATRKDLSFSFDNIMEEINQLLDNVRMIRSENGTFKVAPKDGDPFPNTDGLSSGESELISLAIEVLSFAYVIDTDQYKEKSNWLLLDEPDVHLHPDLQHRLMRLLAKSLSDKSCHVLIATHSTSIVSALSDEADISIATMKSAQQNLEFEKVGAAMKAVLPIFGAHPLSNVFNEKPILLVEGEDDVRIWQQAVRSSGGAIKVWPCAAGDVQSLGEYENTAAKIIAAIYDQAKAFSLRDRDGGPYEIDNVEPVVRAKLQCRAAENLIVSDDVLQMLGVNWDSVREALEQWIEDKPEHPQRQVIIDFKDAGWARKESNIKGLRNVIMAVAGTERPWEVAVGQAVARLKDGQGLIGDDSLASYLGPKIVEALALSP